MENIKKNWISLRREKGKEKRTKELSIRTSILSRSSLATLHVHTTAPLEEDESCERRAENECCCPLMSKANGRGLLNSFSVVTLHDSQTIEHLPLVIPLSLEHLYCIYKLVVAIAAAVGQ